MHTADGNVEFNTKSGKGLRDGVVSELTAFFDVKPGQQDELRAAVQRFADALRKAPQHETEKTGLRYTRHVLFDDGKRLLWTTGFETDWDPYIEDAVVVVGVDHFIDWIQHTTAYEQIEAKASEAFGGIEQLRNASDPDREQFVRKNSGWLKQVIMSVQTPAASYFDALADRSVPQFRRGLQVEAAFQQVLDSPNAAEALRDPALKPLLELAAD